MIINYNWIKIDLIILQINNINLNSLIKKYKNEKIHYDLSQINIRNISNKFKKYQSYMNSINKYKL